MNSQHSMNARRRNIALLIVSLFAVAAVAVSFDRTDANPARAPIIGDFTGEITQDGPVYRLPPIHVVATRKAELARIEREEQLERAREVRARTERKPNA
jgi:hypothetical protein